MITFYKNTLLSLLCWLALPSLAFDKIPVKVGAYEFPPYVQLQQHQVNGLTVELIALLNQLQQKYHFELVMTTAVRRHQDFKQGLFDAIFFEDINWGWKQREMPLHHSAAFAQDDEVFIALRSKAKSQLWFDDLSGKTIAGILGYHYRIADYQTDPKLLASQYLMIPVTDHNASIELVLKQRTDTAIVTRSFLAQYLNLKPHHREILLISERIDQRYQHQLLLDAEHSLDINTLYQWVFHLLQQPVMQQALTKQGLQLLPPAIPN
ncbi:transporter substrate-binding domain-containing protein [Alishewanella tabrizica]|uniref:ABC transporter substrate-binding protein n=1 Tax=Alishewanella tabrizica TaxID=671278 RepID=A0ABQ2WUL6_9ALTE|nr:transporter substrate-binding domain-containing protein [Alishewanella tabrizica]GGW69119.1 ABC transporter substrate-binding protein [Alishewanella tabrizica]